MATHKYRPADETAFDPYKAQPLPLERPVAVYYRQSSEGQIGNISTTLQTVDMVEHLMRQGWERDRILMIDMDAGVSGTKKITERPGMAYLYSLIEGSEIGLVASQDVDRFFRDVTMIETNIFIDACRRNNVLVLTPTFIYDFAHPTQGRYHMQMFRDQAQRAADYLEFHIKGRLVKSRQYLDALGLWAGRSIPVGYRVDLRPKLPDGTQNPDYRKFVRFAPYADVVERYFELFCELEFNCARTWRHIEAHGPFFPELADEMLSEGFRAELNIKTRSRITGGLMPSEAGLRHLFTNVVYIGGWVQNEVVVRMNNHEPVVQPALFMQVFNRMSPIQFDGSPNPDYVPYRPFNRLPEAMRGCEPPVYSSLVYSDDVPGKPRKRVIANYKSTGDYYVYILAAHHRESVWSVRAQQIDEAVNAMLLERLKATTIDEAAWQAALADSQQGDYAEVRRIQQAIKAAERTRQTIFDNLKMVSIPDLVKNLEASYEATERELKRLRLELEQAQKSDHGRETLRQARPVLERIIAHWRAVPRQHRRELFEAFAHEIRLTRVNKRQMNVTVYWRDDTRSTCTIDPLHATNHWEREELEHLRQLVERNAPQIEILRAFPGKSWRNIQNRYLYHFARGQQWSKFYRGKVSYHHTSRWEDTAECKSGMPAQSVMSSSLTCRRSPSGR